MSEHSHCHKVEVLASPTGNPRAFECRPCPWVRGGGKEFKPRLAELGNLNQKCQVFFNGIRVLNLKHGDV